MTGVVFVVAASLAILALVAFAVSTVAFFVQASRHTSSRRWAAAAGASLVLVFGGIADAVRASPKGRQAHPAWPIERTATATAWRARNCVTN